MFDNYCSTVRSNLFSKNFDLSGNKKIYQQQVT